MALQIELHPIAEVEFWEAVDWYDDQKEGLGKLFARVFEKTVHAISERPAMFPIEYGQKRKAVVQKFPYIIIFEIRDDAVSILAVFHASRNPDDWKVR